MKRSRLLARALCPLGLAILPLLVAWQGEGPSAHAKSLGDPVPGLTDAEDDLFIRGRRLFRWQLWPPSRGAEGINSTECTECHQEPAIGGGNPDRDLMVAVIPDKSDPSGLKVFPRIALIPGQRNVKRDLPPEAERRRIPSLFGLGLLEAISEADLVGRADPDDANGDGIRGRSVKVEGGIGRFGSKATVSTIDRFVIQAFKGELGMRVEPIDQPDFSRLGASQVRAVSYFVRNLGAPKPDSATAATRAGFESFKAIGCAKCHTPVQVTSEKAPMPLRSKRVEAYSDLLVHDVGPGPAEPAGGERIGPREFRTTPLWGLGKNRGPFWHDGSAETIEAAVRKHEGEATRSRDAFAKLSEADRKKVLAFLASF